MSWDCFIKIVNDKRGINLGCVWPGSYKPQWCVQVLASRYFLEPQVCPSQTLVSGRRWTADSTAPYTEGFQPAGPGHSLLAEHVYTQIHVTLSGLIFPPHKPQVKYFWCDWISNVLTNLCSHTFTYASRRVLYSKTPEIRCAANLGKNHAL